MDSFPAFFPLAGQTVVIAGAGPAAEAKARLFAGSPATLLRLDDERAWSPEAYRGAVLAFVASEDAAFAEGCVQAARAAGVLLNVVDRPDLCDFTTPAVIDRGEVVAAVGTGGAAPVLATMLRNDIEAQVPEGAGRVAAMLRQAQDEIRSALPDLPARRAFLRTVINGPAAEAARAGDVDAARILLRAEIDGAEAPVGRVRFVSGLGPADLLTLRASRALASADVLIADPDVDPGVLGLVRRDAERLPPETDLAALAAKGLQVVRLARAAPSAEALSALAESGVRVEVLAVAAS